MLYTVYSLLFIHRIVQMIDLVTWLSPSIYGNQRCSSICVNQDCKLYAAPSKRETPSGYCSCRSKHGCQIVRKTLHLFLVYFKFKMQKVSWKIDHDFFLRNFNLLKIIDFFFNRDLRVWDIDCIAIHELLRALHGNWEVRKNVYDLATLQARDQPSLAVHSAHRIPI